MKQTLLLFTVFIFIFISSANAQQKDSTLQFPLLVRFNSFCCGVPDDSLLRKSILKFNKKHKIKRITAFRISPMGKEGEYFLGFMLKELSQKKKIIFIKTLIPIIPLMNDKGVAVLEQDFLYNKTDYSTNVSFEKVVFK